MQHTTQSERQPWKFFLYVFILSVPFILAGYLAENAVPEGITINLPISALMFVNPMIAAAILSYQHGGWPRVRQLFGRVFDFKKINNPIWIIVGLLLLPALYALAYALMRWVGRPLPAPDVPWHLAPVYFGIFFFPAICEELGWMGYAVDPLQNRWGALGASLILGLVGAVWHLIPYIQANYPPGWIFWQSIYTVSHRVLFVWIYYNAGKSVFTAILFHTMSNVSWALFPNNGSHYDPLMTGTLASLAAVVVILLWGAGTLANFRLSKGVSN